MPETDSQPVAYRFLDLTHRSGPEQLAVTEALLGGVAAGASPPTLRLYSWSEPVVIIGVSQSVEDLDLDACRVRGYRVLRRLSGGTAVYHDATEISIDLVVPLGTWFSPSDITKSYARFGRVIVEALARVGAAVRPVSVAEARRAVVPPDLQPACFGGLAPHELVVGGRKVVGLSQIRRRGAVAVQAAIYTRFPYGELAAVLRAANADTEQWQTALRRHAAGLDEVVGRAVNPHEVTAALRAAFNDALDGALCDGVLTDEEAGAVARLAAEKYGAETWTRRR